MKQNSYDDDFPEFDDEDRRQERKDKKQEKLFETYVERSKIMIEECIERILLKYGVIRKDELIAPRMVSMRELCSEFGVSRQTINNWANHRYIKTLVIPHRKYLENRFVFDIEGLRRSLIRDGQTFGIRSNEMHKLKLKSPSKTDIYK
jgi:hypothetical protein